MADLSLEELRHRLAEIEADRDRWRRMAEGLLRLLPEGKVFHRPCPFEDPTVVPQLPAVTAPPPIVLPPSIAPLPYPPSLWPGDVVITCGVRH